MSNSAWMIERNIDGRPHWWMRRDNQFGDWDAPDRWTTDPNKGKKYFTLHDAEHVIGSEMIGCTATEHMWMEI